MLSSPVEEIKNRLDIVDIIGSYLKLQKAGANMRALCPFHSEKSPSFFVSPARQVWRCFGCGVGGDVFKFIMQIEGVEFGDALRSLAQKAGVELQRSPELAKIQTERKQLSELVEWAAKFFETQLASSVGAKVKDYLLKRKFSEESIKKWRLGYSPDSAQSLFQFLLQKGFRADDIHRAGLLVSANGSTYDRFRGRIIFPVFDGNSHVAGFGGRIFGEKAKNKEIAKYINTSNTPLYDKSKILYGLDKAKVAIRKLDTALLVEGYVDTILISQAGLENVVAISGTALTNFHLKILKRYTDNLLLSFDMDLGGDTATKRGIDLAISEGFNVKIVVMPDGKDPADVIAENPAVWAKAVENAKSIFDFYFETTLLRFDKKTSDGKKQIALVLLPLIKRVPNRIEQSHWIALLSKKLGVKEEYVDQELRKLKEEQGAYIRFSGAAVSKKAEPKTRQKRLEERILILFFKDPLLLMNIEERHMHFVSLETQEILEGMKKNPALDFKTFEGIFSKETIESLKHISLESSIEEWERGEDILLEFKNCLFELERLYIKGELKEISRNIGVAEEGKNAEKTKTLLEQFQTVSKNFHTQANT